MARTVLVVDDEAVLRETLECNLVRDGYRVVTAADGREALARFAEDHPDLVVLDLMLPDLSGLDVCRAIRRESEVPILMLTAKDSELDRVVGLELGADDYLTKPFSLRELQARIHALLRRTEEVVARSQPQPHHAASATEPAVEERLGSVVVDLAGHRLVRDGAELAVTTRAFDLLVFLMQHPGEVFTREQLLERVWGYEHPVDTRTVDTGTVDMHIHKLRRVIADDFAVPRFLHTVRTVGYVFRRPP